MRYARILTAAGPRSCVAEGDGWEVVDDMFAVVPTRTGERLAAETAEFLAPVEPSVVLGMLHNSGEADRALSPQAFAKSIRTVVGPGRPIMVERSLGRICGEAELALVVGKPTHRVSVEDAPSHVFGWTIGNDVTNVDQTPLDSTRTQAKNGDGYTPLGPWIETDLDALAAGLAASVDGTVVATGSTAGLAYNPFEVLSYLSTYMTLDAGDVVLTGAPGTAFDLNGATASCEVAGIGVLSNPIVER